MRLKLYLRDATYDEMLKHFHVEFGYIGRCQVAVDDHGTVYGVVAHTDTAILYMHSIVMRHGVGRFIVNTLDHITIAYSVVPTAHAFWRAMGFRPNSERPQPNPFLNADDWVKE